MLIPLGHVDAAGLLNTSARLAADSHTELTPTHSNAKASVRCRALAALPRGAYVINASRGKMVVQDDLIAALDSGHVSEPASPKALLPAPGQRNRC